MCIGKVFIEFVVQLSGFNQDLNGEKQNPIKNGGVAQLGEHLPCKQGVMGSNPIISTIFRSNGLRRRFEKLCR